jgi:hypothetical protein
MDLNNLKLYNKYKYINNPDKELIYIGIDDEGDYWFLFKGKNHKVPFYLLKKYGFDPDTIVEDLNLEIFIDRSDDKYFNGYYFGWYKKEDIEIYFKPILKDKLNNIINR